MATLTQEVSNYEKDLYIMTTSMNVKNTLAVLNKANDAGIAKANLFGSIALEAHNENITGTWQAHGKGSAEVNGQLFPRTFKYLKELCTRDANGNLRGDVSEFAGMVRAFLALAPAIRAEHLIPVDQDAQAKGKSPWQHLKNTLRPKKAGATRATRVTASGDTAKAVETKLPEAHSIANPSEAARVVSAINTWRAAVDAVLNAFDNELPEEVKGLLRTASFYKEARKIKA